MCSQTGNCELDKKVSEWLTWDKNETTCENLRSLVAEKNTKELSKILLKRISFGTAGLRGKMAVGYSCMNDLVIIQTAQGFLKYLERVDMDLLKKNGIAVGYDGRHNSRRWAELTAAIFLHAGYPVRLFSQVNPTPFIPFTVTKYKCASGVMVTASHNPKEDNGYKVYGSNGAQIVSPADKDIQKSILQNLQPLETSWDTSILTSSNLLSDPLSEVLETYLELIDFGILLMHKEINISTKLLFTYTAMHGVGYEYVQKVCDTIGIKIVPVVEQRDPHPDFPTVKFPNPEEGKSSLDLSFKTAEENNSRVIIANDPDADRMAAAEKNPKFPNPEEGKSSLDLSFKTAEENNSRVIIANDPDADRMAAAEKNPKTGEWKVFSGNELGALFGWWMLNCYRIQYPNEPLSNVCMISSTVSSMILKTMSKAEGFNFFDTLTGFKWIGNKALDLEKEGKKVIFCFEEAIGFMCGSNVLDKDGVSAAAQFATMTSYLYSKNQTVTEKLEQIYEIYGQHVSCNSYCICHDPIKINTIFDRIRNLGGQNKYPSGILNDKYKITSIRDLTTGFDNNQLDNKAILPVSPDSQMITLNFSNGLVCTLRTSGTEPKIKYYTELCANPDIKDKNVISDILQEMVIGICNEFLQPKENGLIAKSD